MREVLETFVRYGRADASVLRTLAETEKALQQGKSYATSWGTLFGSLAASAALQN